jgi:hypothetical protein
LLSHSLLRFSCSRITPCIRIYADHPAVNRIVDSLSISHTFGIFLQIDLPMHRLLQSAGVDRRMHQTDFDGCRYHSKLPTKILAPTPPPSPHPHTTSHSLTCARTTTTRITRPGETYVRPFNIISWRRLSIQRLTRKSQVHWVEKK